MNEKSIFLYAFLEAKDGTRWKINGDALVKRGKYLNYSSRENFGLSVPPEIFSSTEYEELGKVYDPFFENKGWFVNDGGNVEKTDHPEVFHFSVETEEQAKELKEIMNEAVVRMRKDYKGFGA